MREVWMLAQRREQLSNLYHYVGLMRRAYEREHPEKIRKILSHILAEQSGAFDRHPSLRERLRAQNLPTANLQLPPPPRPAPDPQLDPKIAPDLMAYIQSAPPCAAAELLGADAVNIQRHLSELAAGRSIYLLHSFGEAA
jgi:hypothetical protein